MVNALRMEMGERMNVLVYGGGAVGLGLAASLVKAGKTVTILAREETADQLRNEGLQQPF
jgi:ketopantoate reductase